MYRIFQNSNDRYLDVVESFNKEQRNYEIQLIGNVLLFSIRHLKFYKACS